VTEYEDDYYYYYYSLSSKMIVSQVFIADMVQRMRTASSVTTSGRKERKKDVITRATYLFTLCYRRYGIAFS
jgi:hypothetical protein